MKGRIKCLISVLALSLTLGACTLSSSETDIELNGNYTISLVSNDYVSVSGLSKSASSGNSVTFNVNVNSGYTLSRVDAYYQQLEEDELISKEIEITGSLTNGYSFLMPEADVVLVVEALGSSYTLSYNEDSVILTDYNGTSLKTGDFFYGLYEPYSGNYISDLSSQKVQDGRLLLVVGKRPYTTSNVKLFASGEELEEIDDYFYSASFFAFAFTMPSFDVLISASADLAYVNVTLDTQDALTEDGEDILNAYLYQEAGTSRNQTLESQKVGTDLPYVHAEVNTAYVNEYSLDSITLTWETYTTNYGVKKEVKSQTTTWSDSVRLPNNANRIASDGSAYYSDRNTKVFQIPTDFYTDYNITITFSLKDLQPYKGAWFLGKWRGFEYYQVNTSTASNEDVTITMLQDGAIVSMVESLGNTTIEEIGENGYDLILDDGRTFYSDGTIGIIPFINLNGSFSTQSVWIFAKGDKLPTIKFWEDSDEDHNVWAAQVFIGDNIIGNVYVDYRLEPAYYVGVTFEFSRGSYVSDSSVAFTVIDANGNTLNNIRS